MRRSMLAEGCLQRRGGRDGGSRGGRVGNRRCARLLIDSIVLSALRSVLAFIFHLAVVRPTDGIIVVRAACGRRGVRSFDGRIVVRSIFVR